MSVFQDLLEAARREQRLALTEAQSKALLASFGIAVPRALVVADARAAADAATQLRAPFVVKVMSPELLHKSDVGGVRVGLADRDAVADAVRSISALPDIQGSQVDGFLVEEMAAPGHEVVIGGYYDPQFGPLVMVGLGGIYVEVLKDVSFRLCPIDRVDAAAMLDELKAAAVLRGARGGPVAAREALIEALMAVGGAAGLLLECGPHLEALDINPLLVSTSAAVAVDARCLLRCVPAQAASTAGAAGVGRPRDGLPVLERFAPLFTPKTVAVVGASATSSAIANTFIRRLRAYGYTGAIYPIHPRADTVEGLPAYPSLAATPAPVDYAYVAIGARQTPALLGAAQGNVRFAQVVSSGFGEVQAGVELERELVERAHAAGVRVVGPNCLGLYSPRGGLTFPDDASRELGAIGVVCQSGGLGTDIIKRGQSRGLRFSALVTVGNSADIGPLDLLEYYLADPQTRVIGLYLESIGDGRRCFELLRDARQRKPVVLLRGGRSGQGRVAAASHTGALAGDDRGWQALARQTALVETPTVDAFLGALLAMQMFSLRSGHATHDVVLFGNGGGTSVLATDYAAEHGLSVAPFTHEVRARLEALDLPPGTSVANPIDTPVRTLQEEAGAVAARILDIVYDGAAPHALVMHLNLASFVGRGDVDPIDNLVQSALDARRRYSGKTHFCLALRSDGSKALDDARRAYRERALAAGIAVYDELPDALHALACVAHIEARLLA